MSAVAALRGGILDLRKSQRGRTSKQGFQCASCAHSREAICYWEFWGFLVKDFRSAGREARLVITPGRTMNLFSDLPLEFPPSPPMHT